MKPAVTEVNTVEDHNSEGERYTAAIESQVRVDASDVLRTADATQEGRRSRMNPRNAGPKPDDGKVRGLPYSPGKNEELNSIRARRYCHEIVAANSALVAEPWPIAQGLCYVKVSGPTTRGVVELVLRTIRECDLLVAFLKMQNDDRGEPPAREETLPW